MPCASELVCQNEREGSQFRLNRDGTPFEDIGFEYSMMALAGLIGIDVPAINLVDVATIENSPEGIGEIKIQAFVIERFDRLDDGTPVRIEDFAQMFQHLSG